MKKIDKLIIVFAIEFLAATLILTSVTLLIYRFHAKIQKVQIKINNHLKN